MDTRDSTTKQWFDENKVNVIRDATATYFLSDPEIVCLSGAMIGSFVEVTFLDTAIELRVVNKLYLEEDMVRLIFITEDGMTYFMRDAAFVLKPAYRRKGIGTRSFAIQVAEAQRQGFAWIEASAIGNAATLVEEDPANQYNGVYTWPRLGYDAKIPEYMVMPCFNAGLFYTKVSEMMASEQGRKLWAVHGNSLDVVFSLEAGSDSLKVHHAYLRAEGVKIS